MPKQAILHLSDLHLSNHNGPKGKIVSWLETKDKYVDEFISHINKTLVELDAKLSKVVITGDLANSGVRSEYTVVKSAIDKLTSQLNLSVSDFIIVPGNHDISWSMNQTAFEDKLLIDANCKACELHDEKFKYFQEFYNGIYGKEYTPIKPILCPLTIDGHQILFVSINSCYKESFMDHKGYIDLSQIQAISQETEENYKEYYKIAVLHHNIALDKADKSIENWNEVKGTLFNLGIRTFLCGHIHSSGIQNVETDYNEYSISAVGSFAKKDVEISNTCSLYVYNKCDENGLHFDNVRMRFCPAPEGLFGQGIWDIDTTGTKRNLLVRKNEHTRSQTVSATTATASSEAVSPLAAIHIPLSTFDSSQEVDYSAKLIEIVRDKQAIVSGHFHWSEQSRTHSWIDTGKLLSDADSLDLVAKALFQTIRKRGIQFDSVIGIGMEGNMLGALIAAAENKPYTYIPVPNRKAYNKYEIEANLTACQKILLVSDVFSTGSTFEGILTNASYQYIKDADEINVLSLFFTGKDDRIRELASAYNNLHIYSVCASIRFGYCSEENPENCPVVKHQLAEVHEFYTKERSS